MARYIFRELVIDSRTGLNPRNFKFLTTQTEYALFSSAAVEAEKVYHSSPAMCAVGCRKALELAVKWVYAADNTMQIPYKDNLCGLCPIRKRQASTGSRGSKADQQRSEHWTQTGGTLCGLLRA